MNVSIAVTVKIYDTFAANFAVTVKFSVTFAVSVKVSVTLLLLLSFLLL